MNPLDLQMTKDAEDDPKQVEQLKQLLQCLQFNATTLQTDQRKRQYEITSMIDSWSNAKNMKINRMEDMLKEKHEEIISKEQRLGVMQKALNAANAKIENYKTTMDCKSKNEMGILRKLLTIKEHTIKQLVMELESHAVSEKAVEERQDLLKKIKEINTDQFKHELDRLPSAFGEDSIAKLFLHKFSSFEFKRKEKEYQQEIVELKQQIDIQNRTLDAMSKAEKNKEEKMRQTMAARESELALSSSYEMDCLKDEIKRLEAQLEAERNESKRERSKHGEQHQRDIVMRQEIFALKTTLSNAKKKYGTLLNSKEAEINRLNIALKEREGTVHLLARKLKAYEMKMENINDEPADKQIMNLLKSAGIELKRKGLEIRELNLAIEALDRDIAVRDNTITDQQDIIRKLDEKAANSRTNGAPRAQRVDRVNRSRKEGKSRKKWSKYKKEQRRKRDIEEELQRKQRQIEEEQQRKQRQIEEEMKAEKAQKSLDEWMAANGVSVGRHVYEANTDAVPEYVPTNIMGTNFAKPTIAAGYSYACSDVTGEKLDALSYRINGLISR